MAYLSLKKYAFALLTALSCAGIVSAQQGKEDARAFLIKAQKAYRESSYLGFKVKYLYSNAGDGVKPMDSLAGEIQMDKDRCRMVLDGTETIVTGRYLIQVMEEDKSMYLSRPGKAIPMSPVQLMDTVFRQLDGIRTDVTTEGRRTILTLQFPPGKMYTRIRMVMDTATGYFQQITYGVLTAGLVGQDQVERPGHPGPYSKEGRIDMVFSNYEKGRFDDALFDEVNFFTRASGRYLPAARYRDYHIFLASSNL
ncbi:MAG TPA: hypothetical protein VHD83_11525 [Puia sp.]|nr:hypothetical protein [Puia sp.]